jgi:hypothetical protein
VQTSKHSCATRLERNRIMGIPLGCFSLSGLSYWFAIKVHRLHGNFGLNTDSFAIADFRPTLQRLSTLLSKLANIVNNGR